MLLQAPGSSRTGTQAHVGPACTVVYMMIWTLAEAACPLDLAETCTW